MALESSHCIHMPLTFKNKLTQNLRLSSSPVNLRKGKCDIGEKKSFKYSFNYYIWNLFKKSINTCFVHDVNTI